MLYQYDQSTQLQRRKSSLQLKLAQLNQAGKAPIHTAVLGDNIQELKQLIDLGVELDLVDSDGYTALHHAALSNKLEHFKILLEHGANPLLFDKHGNQVAHLVAIGKSKEMAEHLSQMYPFVLAFRNIDGLYPFDVACSSHSDTKDYLNHSEAMSAILPWHEPRPLTKHSRTSWSSGSKLKASLKRVSSSSKLELPNPDNFKLMNDIDKASESIDQQLIEKGFHPFSLWNFHVKPARKHLTAFDMINMDVFGYGTKEGNYSLVDFTLMTDRLYGILKDKTASEILNYLSNSYDGIGPLQQMASIYVCKELLSIERFNVKTLECEFQISFDRFTDKVRAPFAQFAQALVEMYGYVKQRTLEQYTDKANNSQIKIEMLIQQIALRTLKPEFYEAAINAVASDIHGFTTHHILNVPSYEWLNFSDRKTDPNQSLVPGSLAYFKSHGLQIAKMVSFDILNADREGGEQVFKFYLHVANRLLNQDDGLNDYNGFFKIMIGLQKFEVARLNYESSLSTKDKNLFAELKSYISPAENFKQLRRAMKGHLFELELTLRDFAHTNEVDDPLLACDSVSDIHRHLIDTQYQAYTLCHSKEQRTNLAQRLVYMQRNVSDEDIEDLYNHNHYLIKNSSSSIAIEEWLALDVIATPVQIKQLFDWLHVNVSKHQESLQTLERKGLSKTLRRSPFYEQTLGGMDELMDALESLSVGDIKLRPHKVPEDDIHKYNAIIKELTQLKKCITELNAYCERHDIEMPIFPEIEEKQQAPQPRKRRRAFSH